eukprot:1160867-Pelagomonas_calceolata.AAC.7
MAARPKKVTYRRGMALTLNYPYLYIEPFSFGVVHRWPSCMLQREGLGEQTIDTLECMDAIDRHAKGPSPKASTIPGLARSLD